MPYAVALLLTIAIEAPIYLTLLPGRLAWGRAVATVVRGLAPSLREWDRRAAESATLYVANSSVVAQRIKAVYDIDALVVNPPSALDPSGPQEPVPGVEPVRIPGVIIIQGDIKTLKEFFEVRLLLMNTSGIFTLSDVQAMISFPNGGLSPTLPEDGIALFDDILPGDPATPGQKQREFIVRGDEIGRRPIEVAFGGTQTSIFSDSVLVPISCALSVSEVY